MQFPLIDNVHKGKGDDDDDQENDEDDDDEEDEAVGGSAQIGLRIGA